MADPFNYIIPNGYDAQHFIRFPVADDTEVISMTGVALVSFKGVDTSFTTTRLEMTVGLPDIPDGHGFRLDHWTVFASLQTITNDGEGDWVGWGVDNFWLTTSPAPIRNAIINCSLVVRDVDGYILRVGYNVLLQGKVIPT
jgi:hypothetical protein